MSSARRLASAILLGSSLLASALCFGQVQDVALKAAYIYNFALFTTWSETASASSSFDVCATPDTPLWDSLQRLNGKPVDDHPWAVVDLDSAFAGQCRIVVLSGAVSLPDSAVGALVIDDGSVEGPSTAAITLINEHEHIRFDVDTRKASYRGLSFSSKLLRLARNVS